ncbi:uncharacterized protein LOC131885946 isoform X2 [Tigriopus californicus]|uniref:uncharacterized protein LOC131885946 isoform X2 n=1 Tax=Tigriopus californicus TaxID=6832 RepID=UPI0027DA6D2C|nr:uncharacterized protein LOC131885946 isoform X2 [Tigriopus californicus]
MSRPMFQFKHNIFIVFVQFKPPENVTRVDRLAIKRNLLIIHQEQEYLQLHTIFQYNKDSPRPTLTLLGLWKRGSELPSNGELFPEKYSNFQGQNFTICTKLETRVGPVVVKRNEKDEEEYSGTYHAILEMHARKHNFNLNYVLKPYNTSEEMMLDVENGVGHMSIIMGRTIARNARFDFGYGPLFAFTGTTFYTQIPTLKASFFGPVGPLSLRVWIAILGSLAAFILTYVILIDENASDMLWSGIKLLAILVGKGSFQSPQNPRGLVLAWIWTIFCLLIGLIYTSVLITYLTMPRFSYVPDTWEELLESDYTIVFTQGSKFQEAFESSDENSIFGQVYKRVQAQQEDTNFDLGYGSVLTTAKRIFLLPKNEKALIWHTPTAVQDWFTLPNGKQLFHISKDVKDLNNNGHLMRKNSPYTDIIAQFDLEMNNMGMAHYFRAIYSYGRTRPIAEEDLEPLNQVTFGLKPLLLEHFYGPLVAWGMGLFLAFISFLYEIVSKRCMT